LILLILGRSSLPQSAEGGDAANKMPAFSNLKGFRRLVARRVVVLARRRRRGQRSQREGEQFTK
jgi:hypothetical protein